MSRAPRLSAEELIAAYETIWKANGARWWTSFDDRIIANVRALDAAGLTVTEFGRNDVYRLLNNPNFSRITTLTLIIMAIGEEWHTVRFLKQGIIIRYSG